MAQFRNATPHPHPHLFRQNLSGQRHGPPRLLVGQELHELCDRKQSIQYTIPTSTTPTWPIVVAGVGFLFTANAAPAFARVTLCTVGFFL